MRRTKLLTYLIALITLVTGALVFLPPGVSADTAPLEIETEAWFGRARQDDPQVDTCLPGPTGPTPVVPATPQPCGATSPADFPAPQAKSTGHYVVAHSGGGAETGGGDGQGDTAWAAFKWDVFDYFGATTEKFVVTLHLGLDRCAPPAGTTSQCFNQGDTYQGQASQTPPPIQACNILEGWSGEAGSNPWKTKPLAGNECIVPTWNPNNKREATFDVTAFGDSWLAGTGHGFVIRPGTPETRTIRDPFQITFAGYYDPGVDSPECTSMPGNPLTTTPTTQATTTRPCTTSAPAPPPKVTFAFTPPEEEDLFEDFDDLGGDEELFEDITTGDDEGLEPIEDLDIIPTDVGSEELAEDVPVDTAEAAPDVLDTGGGGATRPISNDRDTPFPWIILLLLPLAVITFWGTGTALGPMGDPVAARRGGVSRVLADRQAAHRGSDTRNLR